MKTLFSECGDHCYREFSSPSEVTDYIRGNNPVRSWGSSHKTHASEFYGTKTFEEGLALFNRGCPDLVPKIKSESLTLAGEISKRNPCPDAAFDVQGQIIDMGRYLRGEPDCCLRLEKENSGQSRCCSLVVSGGFLNDASAPQIEMRGIVACSLAYLLESRGISTEINVVLPNNSYKYINIGVKIKEFGQPFMLSQIAFVLCHRSFFRRIGFALIESMPEGFYDSNHATQKLLTMPSFFRDVLPKNMLYIGGIKELNSEGIDLTNRASVKTWIEKQYQSKVVRLNHV